MDKEFLPTAVDLFERIEKIFSKIPPRKKDYLDEIEMVFVDLINRRKKGARAFTIIDIIMALESGSKPIGIIFTDIDPEKMTVQEFEDLDTEEQTILMGCFAESQDQVKALFNED